MPKSDKPKRKYVRKNVTGIANHAAKKQLPEKKIPKARPTGTPTMRDKFLATREFPQVELDLYTKLASVILDVPVQEITVDQRNHVKSLVWSWAYTLRVHSNELERRYSENLKRTREFIYPPDREEELDERNN